MSKVSKKIMEIKNTKRNVTFRNDQEQFLKDTKYNHQI